MTTTKDTSHLMTARELGDMLGITDRRVRQMAIDGFIKSPARGLYDTAWAFCYCVASKSAPDRVKELGADLMVAWAWAGGQVGSPATFQKKTWRFSLSCSNEMGLIAITH